MKQKQAILPTRSPQSNSPQPLNTKKIVAISLLGVGVIGLAFVAIKMMGKGDGNNLPEGVQDEPAAYADEPTSNQNNQANLPEPTQTQSQQDAPSNPSYQIGKVLKKSNLVKLEVKMLQYFLNTVNSKGSQNPLKVDGKFGPATLNRVRQYMEDNSLTSITLSDLQKANAGRFNDMLNHYGYDSLSGLLGLPLFGF